MSTLHIFSSLDSFQRGQPMLNQLTPDDAVLLRADALYQLLTAPDFAAGSYAIAADAKARGLDPDTFDQIEWIDYTQWVELTLTHTRSIDW